MKTIKELKLTGKRVFLRVDYNVPIKNGKITNMLRIDASLPTLTHILKQKPKQLIIAAHLGRPKPSYDGEVDEQFSLAPVAKALESILKKKVALHSDLYTEPDSKSQIVLLENLRFYNGEKKGDLKFAKTLASYADVYVNDAFGLAHRKDASVYAVAKQFPLTKRGAGLLIEQELANVHLHHPKPVVALFGPAKISDKLPVLKKLLTKVDKVILGGGVVFTFLKAAGIEIGKSLVEEEMVSTAKELLTKYSKKIVFPMDFVGSTPAAFKNWSSYSATEKKAKLKTVDFDAIPKTLACFDVGPKSIKLFKAVLGHSKTVIWNGPLGVFEVKPYDKSTNEIVKFIAQHKIACIVGGGDTASAVQKTKYADAMTHISTGGGASLELLSGKKLPAISVLEK